MVNTERQEIALDKPNSGNTNSKIIIVGLGPGDPGMIPLKVWEVLNSGLPVYLRTAVHPTVDWLKEKGISFTSFDHHYQRAATFEEVYGQIAREVLTVAERGSVVYAVPGHPMVAEDSVKLVLELAEQAGVTTELVPAMSFLDALTATLGLDPCKGLHIVDALRLDEQQPSTKVGTVVTQVYDRLTAGETKLSLMEYYPDEHIVTVVRGAGIPGEERLERVPLYELDRLTWIDHLTSLYLEPVEDTAMEEDFAPIAVGAGVDTTYQSAYPLDPLVEVMAALRAPNGCPWDREQNHESLKPYLIEEAYEVIDALDQGEMYKICEELGDLLLQIVFHAQIASENGHFDMNDVVDAITEKMLRRHPHVFGTTQVANSQEVLINWDKIKSQEQGEGNAPKHYLANIPKALPALLRAEKVQAKVARIGFDWPDYTGALAKVQEELQEVLAALAAGKNTAVKEEIGDLLFAVVNLARLLQIQSEDALAKTIDKFIQRFQYIEEQAQKQGKQLSELTLEQMDIWWEEAKGNFTLEK
ncbi:nucleoside triphosphate pyrophosphohydrolase [Desulforamulus ferrireducens]|uniref:Nucleoside triphosphate pyrophosphohydrolase n=2 Tax=Desulforamulus ferrireducens TaxID=1833852 RepID=A0A1S6J0A3_9FIRM|nr:nucleoside triphosphate pyrophosphohydrolase [Desulforamulus ferrireducens]